MGAVALAIGLALWFGRDLSAPAGETKAQLEVVKAAVLSFAAKKGEAPAGFEELVAGGFLEVVPQNRGGFPLVYRLSEEGIVEIVDPGPDGKEGGFMFKKDYRIRFSAP